MSALPAAGGGGLIDYDGATTIGLHILPDIAPLYQRRGGRLGTIGGRGTNRGLEAVRAGTADVAGVAREITAEERSEGLRWTLIGHDALGVFVNGTSPLVSLGRAQLKGIFAGAIRDWSAVGGRRGPVVAVTELKSGGRGTIQELRRIALDGEDYGPTLEFDDAPDCVRHVAENVDAITVASMSMALPGARAIAIDGVPPSAANVRSGAYLLGRPLYLVSRAPPAEAVQLLLDVVLSEEGQSAVARRFTPVR